MEPKSYSKPSSILPSLRNCREYLVARRWPDGVVCPRCGGKNVLFLEKYNRWHCRDKHAAPQFTLKTGTIFEDSPLGLDKWLYGNVDDCELQKRDQLLGDFPLFGSNAKVRMVHGSQNPHGIAERLDLQDGRTRQRSGSR